MGVVEEPRNTYIFYGDVTVAAGRGLNVPDDVVLAHMKDNQDILSKDISHDGRQYMLIAQHGHKISFHMGSRKAIKPIR